MSKDHQYTNVAAKMAGRGKKNPNPRKRNAEKKEIKLVSLSSK